MPPKINVQDRLLAEVEAQQRDSPGLCQEPGKNGDEAGGSCTVGNLFAASAAAKMPAAGELSTRTLLRAGANVAGAAHGTGGGGEGISVPVQERHDGVPAAAGGGGGGVLGCEPNDSLEGASRDSVKRVLEGGDGGGLAEMGFGGGRASKRVKLETRGGGEEGRGGGGKGQGEGGDGSEVESTVKIAGGDADCEGKPMGVSSTSNTSGEGERLG